MMNNCRRDNANTKSGYCILMTSSMLYWTLDFENCARMRFKSPRCCGGMPMNSELFVSWCGPKFACYSVVTINNFGCWMASFKV